MANTVSPVEEFWRGATETEAFRFFELFDNSDPDSKELADASEDILTLMGEPDSAKRIDIANRILKDGKPDLGIAHIVLARSSDRFSEKEKHYREAQKNSIDQQFKTTKGIILKGDMLYAATTLEFADALLRNGKQEEALKELQELLGPQAAP